MFGVDNIVAAIIRSIGDNRVGSLAERETYGTKRILNKRVCVAQVNTIPVRDSIFITSARVTVVTCTLVIVSARSRIREKTGPARIAPVGAIFVKFGAG